MSTEYKVILHIEDTDIDAETVRRALKKYMKEPYRIEHARTMSEAEIFLRNNNNVDVILLDLGLPDTNDRMDTFERLKNAKQRPVPTIVLTSVNDRELAVDMIGSGAGDYVRKSIIGNDPESLCDAIEFVWRRENNLAELEEEQQKALSDKDDIIYWMGGGYSYHKDNQPKK